MIDSIVLFAEAILGVILLTPNQVTVTRLLWTASSGDAFPKQSAAVDALAPFAKQHPDTLSFATIGLRGLLRHPAPEPKSSLFRLHVVQALGDLGPAAQSALPDLAVQKGNDRILDDAIDAAVKSILTPVSAQAPAPMLPVKKEDAFAKAFETFHTPEDEAYIDGLVVLVNKEGKTGTAALCLRLLAAKELERLAQKIVALKKEKEILQVLALIATDKGEDAELTKTCQKAIDNIHKPAGPKK
jgi:hypothetical protein